jgi:hypothetical protein
VIIVIDIISTLAFALTTLAVVLSSLPSLPVPILMPDLLPLSLPQFVFIIVVISATLAFTYATLAVAVPFPNTRLAPIHCHL